MAEEKGVWRTVAGRRIFIRDGESLSESMKRSGKFKGKLSQTKTLKKNDPIKDFNNDVDKKIEELSKGPDAYKKLGEYANELRHIRNKDIEDNDMYEAYTRAYDRVIDKKDELDKAKTTSKDDSYAYTKNWSKEDAEKYIASQLKNNEGHDSVLLEKDGHYDVAKNWKEAEDAIKNHGWKHEKEDVDKIRRMAGLDKNNSEEKMAAIKEAYEKQQSFKDTTYEVMEKDGKYKVVGGNNNGSDDPGSWRSKKRDLLERGYKELPDSDYKEFMNSVKEKKYDNGRTEKVYDPKKEKKPAYGRKAVKLDDLQKEVAEFSKDLDQDKWAKQMREDYVKQVYYSHARELNPVPHKGADGKEYVYGNDDMNEYRIETSYLSSALRGDLAGWYNNATRVNSRAPREWQLKVDKLVKDKFVNTYGTWEDYQASKKKKK